MALLRSAVLAVSVALAVLAASAAAATTTKDYLFVGGSFSQLSYGVGRGNALGSLYDGTRWQSMHNNLNTGGFYAAATYKGELYVGGQFSRLSSNFLSQTLNPIYNIAKWNQTSTFYAHIGNGGGASGTAVYALTVANNLLYVGGDIGALDGVSVSGIAAWNGTHASALGSGVGGIAYAIAVYNGDIIVAGSMATLKHVARWNATAGTWSALGGGAQYISYALAVFKGRLFLGGDFTATGTVTNYYLGAWNGTAWLPMPRLSLPGSSAGVRTFHVDGDTLYMGGGFTQIDGVSANRIASTTTGDSWTAVGGVDGDGRGITNCPIVATPNCEYGTVYAITRYQGMLYVGGDIHFTASYGFSANWMVRYNTTRQSWVLAPAGIMDGAVRTFLPSYTAPFYTCDSIANCLYTNPNTTSFASILLDETFAFQWLYSYLDLNSASVIVPTNTAWRGVSSSSTVNGYDLSTTLAYMLVWSNQVIGFTIGLDGYTKQFATEVTDSRYVSGTGGVTRQVIGLSRSAAGSITISHGAVATTNVVAANIKCSNGYINLVNEFLTVPDTVPVMLARFGLTEFSAALTKSGLMANVTALTVVTILAPTNAAFAKDYPGWRNLPNARLLEMLKGHIVTSRIAYFSPGQTGSGNSLFTMLGHYLYVSVSNTNVYSLNDGWIGTKLTTTRANVFTRNGVIHVVDTLLARATNVVYTTVNLTTATAQLDNDDISLTKDCTVRRSGTVYGGWTVDYQSNKLCCVTRGIMTDGTLLTGCDSASVTTVGLYTAAGSTKGYTNCYGGDIWLNIQDTVKNGTASRTALDASSSFGNSPTTVKRTAALMTTNLQDGAYKFTVTSGSRRATTSTAYCTGKGLIVVADNGDKSCQLNVCGQTTPHYLVVDLASATDGTTCFHTCFT